MLFILLVVRMVCAKNFSKERTDIGIYKAIGFTAGRLRLQFAFRFLVVSLLGTLASVCFSAPLLGCFLRVMGVSRIPTSYTLETVLLPIFVMGACFFVFAWLAVGRVKRVAVRELIVE